LREAIGTPLAPNEQISIQYEIAAIHAALGEVATAAAFARGRALTLEQVLEDATQEVEPAAPDGA
jgi:hypothetical protein